MAVRLHKRGFEDKLIAEVTNSDPQTVRQWLNGFPLS